MEEITEKLLYDMTNFGKKAFKMHYMDNCYQKLGFDTFEKLNEKILHWQKAIQNPDKAIPNENFYDDRLILDTVYIDEYKDFFKHCPELETIFSLKGDKIIYNEDLTKEEINEIKKYIDDNHKIQIRIRRKRP